MNSVANLALAAETQVGNIAFIDLRAQQRRIRPAVERRLQAVLDHGRYIAGPEISELEEKLAERTGAKAAIACASGTAALIIPLLAQGVGAGDAVFVPAFTYNATANAVLLSGATPVFVDIDPATFNMDPAHLEHCIADVRREGKLNPRAIIPVDLFGSPADYRAFTKIAAQENLFLFSDGAQSFGGRLDNRWVGDLAPATATSFSPVRRSAPMATPAPYSRRIWPTLIFGPQSAGMARMHRERILCALDSTEEWTVFRRLFCSKNWRFLTMNLRPVTMLRQFIINAWGVWGDHKNTLTAPRRDTLIMRFA